MRRVFLIWQSGEISSESVSGKIEKTVGESVEKVVGDSLSKDSFGVKIERLLKARVDQIIMEQKMGKPP